MPKTLPSADKAKSKNKPLKAIDKPGKQPKAKAKTKAPSLTENSASDKAIDKLLRKADKLARRKAKLDALVLPGKFIQARKSSVHGKGVFAVAPIAEGQHLIEYIGEHIGWKEALRRHPHDPAQPNHTFYFSLEDGNCIDANVGGNDSRWINHSCKPNCEADETHGRVFIKALRNIDKGEELFYDYGLVIDEKYTKKLKSEYACWCGAKKCRGTMLAPKGKKD
jgi:uncharacterized protein